MEFKTTMFLAHVHCLCYSIRDEMKDQHEFTQLQNNKKAL